jgi:O-acetyl-ADP-ribose deacetylase (regulator of RNase III)
MHSLEDLLLHTGDTITDYKEEFTRSHYMTTIVAEHNLTSGQIVRLVHGDLTEEKVDAIVNAANAQLAHGGGVAGAIVRVGGQEIQIESDAWVRDHGPVSHEQPALTTAGRLPCRYVIHAVGPVWGEGDEDAKLHSAVTGALALADQKTLTCLALPAISTGIFGFPKDRGARVILDAIVDYFAEKPDTSLNEIRITLIDEPSVVIFTDEFSHRWPGSVTSA